MIPIMRAAIDPKFKRVTLVCGAQMAKTEALFNVMGHRLEDDPKPILYIGPTQKLVESYSEGRVMPMIKTCETLWERLAKGKKNKITEKFIGGVRLGFGWAGSATELAGHPAALVLVDERDRMTMVKGEGDPVSLAEARTSTYPDGKVIVASTPTVGNVKSEFNAETGIEHWGVGDEEELASPIWRLWQKGTRAEWAWPCPHCREYFVPRFKHLHWPEKSTPDEARTKTKLACPKCGALIDDLDKSSMNARGRFVCPGQRITPSGEVLGDAPKSTNASFWISGLCSPWRSFGSRAADFLGAVRVGNQDEVQVALNTGCGELYALGGDAPAWEAVRALAEGYESGSCPGGVQMITCAVDVQKDRLVYGIRGWGYNSESWLIEADEIHGETAHDAVWMELSELLTRDYDGKTIRRMFIDSGYKPGEKERNPDNQIYMFCYRHRGIAFPTKGHDTQDRPVKASKIDITYRGKLIKNGLDLWHVDSDYCKSWVHARIEWPHGEPGAWHLPVDVTDDYCQQVTAEARTVNPSGKIVWIRIRKSNHFLDVEALQVACAHSLRLFALPKPAEKQPASAVSTAQVAAAQRVIAAPRRSNWTTGWRD
jgi:phage terminase large subunit GpA-like protein